MRDNLIEHEAMARLSRKLVALHTDTAVPHTLDELKLEGIPPEPLRAFLEDQGFKTLLSRMAAHAPGRETADPVAAAVARAESDTPDFVELPPIDCNTYETVTTLDRLEAWIAESHASGTIAIDTETDSLDSMAANLVGICLATRAGPRLLHPDRRTAAATTCSAKSRRSCRSPRWSRGCGRCSSIPACSRSGTTSNTTSTC